MLLIHSDFMNIYLPDDAQHTTPNTSNNFFEAVVGFNLDAFFFLKGIIIHKW